MDKIFDIINPHLIKLEEDKNKENEEVKSAYKEIQAGLIDAIEYKEYNKGNKNEKF